MKAKNIIILESILILLGVLYLAIFPIHLKKEISDLCYNDAKKLFNTEMVQDLEDSPVYIQYHRDDLDPIQLGVHFLDYLMGFEKYDISYVEYQIIDNKYCYVKKDTLLKGCASVLYDIDTNMIIGYIIDDKPLI